MKYLIIISMAFMLTSCKSNKYKYEDLNYKDQLIVDLIIENVLFGCVDLKKTSHGSGKPLSDYYKKYGEYNNIYFHDWLEDTRKIKYSSELFFEGNDPDVYVQIDGYKVNNKTIQVAQEKINSLLNTDYKVTLNVEKVKSYNKRHISLDWVDDKNVKGINTIMGFWIEPFYMEFRNGKWRKTGKITSSSFIVR